LVDRVAPAVVNISVHGTIRSGTALAQEPFNLFDFRAPRERPFDSAGSGVIVDAARGYLLTNHHVIENATDITITLVDDRKMPATVVGSDQASDLAVLQVESRNLSQLEIAAGNDLKVGDYVVAIGNPFGFSNTVTAGIVSGLGRRGLSPGAYEDFIQTDASINPGNSGGALVNLNGELVGINSAIISRTGGNIGIGFAIPVEMARSVMEQLIEFGEVRRGLLGVGIGTISEDHAETLELPNTAGALVTAVNEDSAAENAGIQVEDFIVSVDGKPVSDSNELRNTIGLMPPGSRVVIGLIRDGVRLEVPAVLDTRVDATAALPPERELIDPVFDGVELVPSRSGSGPPGLVVQRIDDDSPAAERGLRTGDVITFINRQRVRSLAEATAIVANARSVLLQVQRGRRALLIVLR
jgi:Do/DeqQ family serine protease